MPKKKNKAPAEAAASAAAPITHADPIDVAYAAGNYAAVRRMAASHPSEHASALVSRIVLDPVQILIGAFALFVVSLAAFLTLN